MAWFSFRKKKRKKKRSKFKLWLNIATIVSIVMLGLKAAFKGWIDAEWAAAGMIVGVFILAVDSNLLKMIMTALSIFYFIALAAQGNETVMNYLFAGILTIVVMMVGFYIMFRSFFKDG